jgi:hypothetical protein
MPKRPPAIPPDPAPEPQPVAELRRSDIARAGEMRPMFFRRQHIPRQYISSLGFEEPFRPPRPSSEDEVDERGSQKHVLSRVLSSARMVRLLRSLKPLQQEDLIILIAQLMPILSDRDIEEVLTAATVRLRQEAKAIDLARGTGPMRRRKK